MAGLKRILWTGAWIAAAAAAPCVAQTNDAPAAVAAEEGDERRDPFWPVGYSPSGGDSAPVENAAEKTDRAAVMDRQWREAQAGLAVGGITKMGETVLVMIEGEPVGAGDVVKKTMEGTTFRWQVMQIGEGGITLKKISAKPAENAKMDQTSQNGETR